MKAKKLQVSIVVVLASDELQRAISALSDEEEDDVASLEYQNEDLRGEGLESICPRGVRVILHQDVRILRLDKAVRFNVGVILRWWSNGNGISNSVVKVSFPDNFVKLAVLAELADLDVAILTKSVTSQNQALIRKDNRQGKKFVGFANSSWLVSVAPQDHNHVERSIILGNTSGPRKVIGAQTTSVGCSEKYRGWHEDSGVVVEDLKNNTYSDKGNIIMMFRPQPHGNDPVSIGTLDDGPGKDTAIWDWGTLRDGGRKLGVGRGSEGVLKIDSFHHPLAISKDGTLKGHSR
jgi:hypothetical protein